MVLLNHSNVNPTSDLLTSLTFHYGAIEPLVVNGYGARQDKLTFHYGAIEPQ